MTYANDTAFSGCPYCSAAKKMLNIGRSHYFLCDEHGTAWCVGENLFSAWRDESEADRQESRARLQSYTIVNPRSGPLLEVPPIAEVSRRHSQRPALKSKDQALEDYARHAPKGYFEISAYIDEKEMETRATTELRAGDICILLGDDVGPLSAAEFLERAAQMLRKGAIEISIPAAVPEWEPDRWTKQLRRIWG